MSITNISHRFHFCGLTMKHCVECLIFTVAHICNAQIFFSSARHKFIQCTHLFLSAQIYFSVHKCNSQCTNVFSVHKCIFSAQIYFSVHKYISQCTCISQCTNIFFSAQIYLSVHKSISQCTNVFLSAQIYFSVHKSISQCTNLFLSVSRIISCYVWMMENN